MAVDGETSREAVAHHEAGHAVAAVVLRIAIDHATILPDDDGGLGHVGSTRPPMYFTGLGPTRDRARREAAQSLAGARAQARFLGVDLGDLDSDTWESDRCEAADHVFAAARGPDDAQHLLGEAERLAVETLARPDVWAAVEAVAAALLARDTLPGRDVRRIVRELVT